jgi:hypothetical protein
VSDDKTIYAEIWAQFAHEVKQSESKAFSNLRDSFALHASELVPDIMTHKELTDSIEWAQSHVKTDQAEHSSDPMLLMEQWMQGLVELSRIPMGKVS